MKFPSRSRNDSALIVAVLVAVLAATTVFAQAALTEAVTNWDSTSGDQGGYLRMTRQVLVGDGFSNGNYHPLLAFLLQTVAHLDGWAAFSAAKLVGVALGVLTIGTTLIVGWRLFGPLPGLFAATLLSANMEYVVRSARVEPDVLLTGLFVAAWGLWASARREQILAGVLAGLAYLAKGTGQFFLVAFVADIVVRRTPLSRLQPSGWRSRSGLLVLLYLLTCMPLLVDRTREFGYPFYSFPSSHAMWYDDWDDKYLSDDGRHATAITYVRSHSVGQVVDRVRHGLVSLPHELWTAMRLRGPEALSRALALALLLLAVIGVTQLQRIPRGKTIRNGLYCAALLIAPMYLFFAWYIPVIASPRFLLPLAPIVYLLLSALTVGLLRLLLPARAVFPTRIAFTVAILVLSVAQSRHQVPHPSIAELFASDRQHNAASVELYDELVAIVPNEAEVLLGPDSGLATWPFYGRVSFEPIASTVTTADELVAFAEEQDASHLVVAPGTVRRRPDLLQPFFDVADIAVQPRQALPNWELLHTGDDSSFLIYGRTSE